MLGPHSDIFGYIRTIFGHIRTIFGPHSDSMMDGPSMKPLGIRRRTLSVHACACFAHVYVCFCRVCCLPSPHTPIHKGGGASRRLHKGGRPPSAAAPLCGFLYMGLSMGTGSCLWDARPAMSRVAYGFLPGSEHRALSHVSAFLSVSPWV